MSGGYYQYQDGLQPPRVERTLPVSPLNDTANDHSSSRSLVELGETGQPLRTDTHSTATEEHMTHQHAADTQSLASASTIHQATSIQASLERSSTSDHEPNRMNPLPSEGRGPTSWWWWWEIMATILSIVCMAALVIILVNIDNVPLPHWWLPIQPNSLIAVLTTVAKSSMMLSVASCISQMKWGHFSQHPRKLLDLETFDEASRGPWGSATLLWLLSFRTPVLFTSGLALVTIVSLGIDPCAQQVLEFPLQSTSLDNITAEMGVATQYFSKGMLEDPRRSYIFVPNADLLNLQASIIGSAVGTVFQPHFSCPAPATRCYWEEFTTLGVCSDYRNVTSIAESNCTKQNRAGSINCTYTFPGMSDTTTLFGSLFHQSAKADVPIFGSFTAVKPLDKGYPTMVNRTKLKPPPVQISYAELGWCEQQYRNVTATQAGISHADVKMTSERLISTGETYLPDDPMNKMGAFYESYKANSTGQIYNISRMASILPNVLEIILTSNVVNNIYRPDFDRNIKLDLGYALLSSPFERVTVDLAAALTNQIRSVDPGDNYNATTIKGKAVYDETYIRVRWPWMILPLAEITLSALLLVASIIVTWGMPLWKTSGLAFLVSGRWEEDEFDTFVRARKGREKLGKEALEEWGKGVKARLIEGDKDGAAKG
ncbi:hypothetical protein PG995_006605, partial [Apiospora arundinis]